MATLPESCPKCQSTNLVRITGEDELTTHYGRLKCGDCGKHIQWLRDPSTTITTMQRQSAIESILQNHKSKLRPQDIQFLRSIHPKRCLTDRQQDYLNSLSRQCLGVNICQKN
ncbi:MAG: hypothetical protein HC907_32085 [Richelia sp. SM1_7_0]|nr:hypothetical protein [Richelia sp. SM1_7_0]